MAVRPRTRWTADTSTAFLLALRQHGQVRLAAREIGRDETTAYDVRKRDPAFAARWQAVIADLAAAARAERERLPREERIGRQRRDGWNADKRGGFLAALAQEGTVVAACAAAGMSTHAAYALRQRSPRFAAEWDRTLYERACSPTEAAYKRAVEGWDEPIVFQGKVIAHRKRYSDAALRLLIQREDKRLERAEAAAAVAQERETKYYADPEDTNRALLKKLEQVEKARALRLANDAARADAGTDRQRS